MVQLDALWMRHGQPRVGLRMTWPHTLQERGPFTCPRCGAGIRWVASEPSQGPFLEHDEGEPVCTWLDEATDEQAEALK